MCYLKYHHYNFLEKNEDLGFSGQKYQHKFDVYTVYTVVCQKAPVWLKRYLFCNSKKSNPFP